MTLKPKIKSARHKGFMKASQAALLNHPKAEIYQKAMYRYKVVSTWGKAADEFFEGAQNQSKAVDFKDGVLFVACLSKELANKIKMFAGRIIYLLNQLLGKELVFALRVEF